MVVEPGVRIIGVKIQTRRYKNMNDAVIRVTVQLADPAYRRSGLSETN